MPIDPKVVQDLRDRLDGHNALKLELSELEAAVRVKRRQIQESASVNERVEVALIEYVLRDVDPSSILRDIEPSPAVPVDPVADTMPAVLAGPGVRP